MYTCTHICYARLGPAADTRGGGDSTVYDAALTNILRRMPRYPDSCLLRSSTSLPILLTWTLTPGCGMYSVIAASCGTCTVHGFGVNGWTQHTSDILFCISACRTSASCKHPWERERGRKITHTCTCTLYMQLYTAIWLVHVHVYMAHTFTCSNLVKISLTDICICWPKCYTCIHNTCPYMYMHKVHVRMYMYSTCNQWLKMYTLSYDKQIYVPIP